MKAYYVGVGGDGHWGRLNITHQFYQAFGEDEFNGISGQPIDINAQFAAVELSIDKDWLRPRVGFVWASGDGDPDDDKATGFDAILDNPNIAGGPFSFWNRQGLRLRADRRRPRRPQQRAAVAAQQQDRRTGELRQPGRACCSTPGSTPS